MTDITPNINFKNDPPLYDLQEVIQQYQSQPELLKLILTSKVEEDKRRAEEAKLRAKELDLYFQHKEKKSHKILPSISSSLRKSRSSSLSSPYAIPPLSSHSLHHQTSASSAAAYRSYHSSISSTSSSSGSVSSLSELEEEEEEEEDIHMDHQQRRHSAAAAMLAMGGAAAAAANVETISNAYPSPIDEHYSDEKEEAITEEDEDMSKPRRRREMQAITKIVETREFPYVDNYFWKNNGNTVQKKTGCKSIYYKCSNSNKGCSVNKTVTARPNGEYLIKYRGCHLQECGRVERIRDL
ncbi:hypothetical protein V8B55DRAFT_1486638 [Mucor lusitanicus]|nr:hypothetical protein FB192DRAFT_1402756 [Mucor lusitanicus]